jgi:hypothetical protein
LADYAYPTEHALTAILDRRSANAQALQLFPLPLLPPSAVAKKSKTTGKHGVKTKIAQQFPDLDKHYINHPHVTAMCVLLQAIFFALLWVAHARFQVLADKGSARCRAARDKPLIKEGQARGISGPGHGS